MPVCAYRCTFCHYPTVVQKSRVGHWVDLALEESRVFLDEFQSELSSLPVTSLYMGGGTPSMMTAAELHRLIGHVRRCYQLSREAEVTLEGTPETLSQEHLAEIREAGVNRLSIGVQTLRDDLLAGFNRQHSSRAALEAMRAGLRTGFDKVNVDLMYGLPGQEAAQFLEDLDVVVNLRPESVTLYRLRLGRSGELPTSMFRRYQEEPDLFPEPNEVYAMQEVGRRVLTSHGYQEGPVGWFHLPQKAIRVYADRWDSQVPMVAFGWWTYSYSQLYEYYNLKHPRDYESAVRGGELPLLEAMVYTFEERVRRFFVFRLKSRLAVSRADLERHFPDGTWRAALSAALGRIDGLDLLTEDSTGFALTPAGVLLIEEVIDRALRGRMAGP